MSKKIEVKVNMHCQTCKTEVLKAVTKVLGIDEVSVELEKQMLIVIGDVDPVCVVTRVRKIGKIAQIVSVGPPKKPDPAKESQSCSNACLNPCLNPCPIPFPNPCPDSCQVMYPGPICNDYYAPVMVGYPQSSCDGGGCFIL